MGIVIFGLVAFLAGFGVLLKLSYFRLVRHDDFYKFRVPCYVKKPIERMKVIFLGPHPIK